MSIKKEALTFVKETAKDHSSGILSLMHAFKVLIYVIAISIFAGVCYAIIG